MRALAPLLPWAAVMLGLAACAPAVVVQEDRDGLIRLTRMTDASGALTVTVTPTRAALRLNARSLPRFVGADGVEHLLTGPADVTGEKLAGSASATVPRGAGTLHVSVCDSAVGVCRKTTLLIDA